MDVHKSGIEKIENRHKKEKQELLRLHFSAGLGFAEIALLENRPHKDRGLSRSEAAVKMALYRTLDWLREHWEAENG